MTLKEFLNVVLSFNWENLFFHSSCEDGGSPWLVHSKQELFKLLADEISSKDDTFTIIEIS